MKYVFMVNTKFKKHIRFSYAIVSETGIKRDRSRSISPNGNYAISYNVFWNLMLFCSIIYHVENKLYDCLFFTLIDQTVAFQIVFYQFVFSTVCTVPE